MVQQTVRGCQSPVRVKGKTSLSRASTVLPPVPTYCGSGNDPKTCPVSNPQFERKMESADNEADP
ncbi:MAG: hypothetical protein ACOXZI_00615 [Candidatus Cryptobacteroides sp.]